MNPQYIPDIFAQVVQRVSTAMQAIPVSPFPVYFDHGHYREVLRQLEWKDQSILEKEKKFPLVWLVMDFEETMGEHPGFYAKGENLHLWIMNNAESTWTMKERRDNNFLPVLYPIMAELVKQISESAQFGMPTQEKIKFRKIDRPNVGIETKEGVVESYLFNNAMDAIQIRNLKVNIKNIC